MITIIVSVLLLGFSLSIGRFLNFLICLENFNVFIILLSLLVPNANTVGMFLPVLVMVTIHSSISLVVLTRLWSNLSVSMVSVSY